MSEYTVFRRKNHNKLITSEIVLISRQDIKESFLYIKTAQLLVYKKWGVRQ